MTDARDDTAALQHVAWLAREKRHTTDADTWAIRALHAGWAIRAAGIMCDQSMWRVELTSAGKAAIAELPLRVAREAACNV